MCVDEVTYGWRLGQMDRLMDKYKNEWMGWLITELDTDELTDQYWSIEWLTDSSKFDSSHFKLIKLDRNIWMEFIIILNLSFHLR